MRSVSFKDKTPYLLAVAGFYIAVVVAPFAGLFAASSDTSGSTFALVLSGGGARGLSQIGVLKALDEAHLKPDLIVGTSMGAIIGGLYSAGYSPDSIAHIVKSVNWNDIFANSAKRNTLFVSQKSEPVNYLFELRFNDRLEPIPPNSISHGQIFFDLLAPLLAPAQFRSGMNFDSLPIPLRIVATDLVSGKRVVFSKGNLAAAIRSSCGVALAFSPIKKDGMLLMDGGLASNIPIDVAREKQDVFILAIDVTSPLRRLEDLENPVRIMDQIVNIGIQHQKDMSQNEAGLVITPELAGFFNTDFRNIDTLIHRGYVCMLRNTDTLKKIIEAIPEPSKRLVAWPKVFGTATGMRLISALDTSLRTYRTDSITENNFHRLLESKLAQQGYPFGTVTVISRDSAGIVASVDTGMIRDITITGNDKTSRSLIITASGIKRDEPLQSSTIRKAITSLHATNLFNNVNIDMDTSGNVRIMVDEKKYWRVRMGLRYDEFHYGEGFVQPAYENLFGKGVCALLHLQYGLRREKYSLALHNNHLFSANFANNAELRTYISSERIFSDTIIIDTINSALDTTLWHAEKNLRRGGVIGLIGIQIGRSTMLSGGLHCEFFKIQAHNPGIFKELWGLQFLPYALLRLSMDTMDKLPFPTTGIKNFVSIGGSSKFFGGTKEYIKFDGSIRRVFTICRRHTFSPQVRFAWSSSPLLQAEQLYIGGSFPEETHQDMEIYNYIPFLGMFPRAMSGDVMGVAHLGYDFLIRKSVYLTAGIDWGYAWTGTDFSWKRSGYEFVENAPVGLGIGCGIETFFGPIRISYGKLMHDYAQKGILSDNKLYASIGHDF